MRRSTQRPEPQSESRLTDPPRGGLEEWLRKRGVRPGPVYTIVQLTVVVAAVILAVLLFSLFA
jgi:hypothetical protein